jgi:hypothetical protein
MIRRRSLSIFVASTFLFVIFTNSSTLMIEGASADPPEPKLAAPNGGGKADQLGQIQRQLAELQTQVNELKKSRILAAGTATYTRPSPQDNKSYSRIKLSAEIASKLGDEYIVLLTNRYPTGGYPFFGCYWKRANEGFDIYVVDISVNDGTTVLYDNPNTKYLVDWAVIKK